MDEAKLISRQIAETRVEIAVCTRLKTNGVMMRLGKPVGDLLVAYEMKLVDLENQLQALTRKPTAKPGANAAPAKPAAPIVPRAPAPVSTKPPAPPVKPQPAAPRPVLIVKQPAVAAAPAAPAKVAAKPAPTPAPAKAAVAKSAALEPKAAPRKAAPSAGKSRK